MNSTFGEFGEDSLESIKENFFSLVNGYKTSQSEQSESFNKAFLLLFNAFQRVFEEITLVTEIKAFALKAGWLLTRNVNTDDFMSEDILFVLSQYLTSSTYTTKKANLNQF